MPLTIRQASTHLRACSRSASFVAKIARSTAVLMRRAAYARRWKKSRFIVFFPLFN
jgi:hypothetical protein